MANLYSRRSYCCAFIAVLCAVSMGVSEARARENQDDVAAWSERAETMRRAIDDEDDQALVDVALAGMYARQGSAAKSLAAVRRVIGSDSEKANSELWQVAIVIAEHLESDATVQLFQAVEDPSRRGDIAKYVFMQHGATGKLAVAREQEGFIENEEARFEAWMWFAIGANSARRFDSARQAIRDLKPQNDDQQQRLTRTTTAIQRRSREPNKKPLTADELWEKAAKSNDSSHWRDAASANLKRGDGAKCRDALERAEASGESLDLYSIKVANLALIAHTFLEMGDSKEATRVVRKAVDELEAAAPDEEPSEDALAFDIEGVIGGLFVAPVLVNVLTRCGDWELALEMAETGGQWVALGNSCLSDELQTVLQQRLADIQSPRDRALVCIGVVQGLVDNRNKAANNP